VLARSIGAHPDIAEATDRLNDYQIDRLVKLVKSFGKSGANVSVLGMSYKPDTPVIEESQGVELSRRLVLDGFKVTIFDPLAQANAVAALGDRVAAAASLEAAVAVADVIVITTPWVQFKSLAPTALRKGAEPVAIIDCWRVLQSAAFAGVADVIYLGFGRAR